MARLAKPVRILAVAAIAVAVFALVACSSQTGSSSSAPSSSEASPASGIPDNSILLAFDDERTAKLVADMEEGRIPTECLVLYDQMGSRPSVTLTDPDQIAEIYRLFSQITVEGKSNMSITDSYHQVGFTLQDGTHLHWMFEGEELLSADDGRTNYAVSGGGPLWRMVQQLQDAKMETREQ